MSPQTKTYYEPSTPKSTIYSLLSTSLSYEKNAWKFFLIMCVWGGGEGAGAGVEARGDPGAGVTRWREPSHVGAGNQS